MLWGGYTVKILISGTTKQEQHLTTWQHSWVPRKHLGACVVLAVVSFQLRHFFPPSPKSWRHGWVVWHDHELCSHLSSPLHRKLQETQMSTASKLEEAEHKVQALQTGLAWLLWPFPGGQGWLGVSGLGVKQLLACREVQQSSEVLCESEQTLLLQLSLANKGTMGHTQNQNIPGITAGHGTYPPCVFCFHTFPNCAKYLCEPCFLPVAMTCH